MPRESKFSECNFALWLFWECVIGVFIEHKNGLDIPAGKQAFRDVILASWLFWKCVIGVFTKHKNDQEMDVRKLRFRHPLPGLGGCFKNNQKRLGYTRWKASFPRVHPSLGGV
jgi:hypothetical protein